MNVLILNGSPRRGGSTERMAEAFAAGAREAGHRVTILPVGRMRINGCMGCEYCHTRGGGQCVQRDDEAEVYAALAEAEVLVALMLQLVEIMLIVKSLLVCLEALAVLAVLVLLVLMEQKDV